MAASNNCRSTARADWSVHIRASAFDLCNVMVSKNAEN
jgi:hypothetical protein